ncbi:GPI ethanolamine phosphate transferase 3-like [Myxocyprinus asiaticus]|uniref:GPI ethanolamine phosphate transferase 3-like n=1 Tax=Myxocyprinus asiaticus TaxID=70543 RepID=UPI002223A5F8|nr:GPI ethanolamine phosphate transferase 3-like [Myxocyprinus asiaticus]
MEGDDWDVLIAHFLGVDHCGHRFGPDHPAMAEKLSQMDGVIRSVIKRLKNDTLLVVMGDHGMTDTGDHGGESQKETDAALFLYSSSTLFPAPGSQVEPEVVPQTDLVPTLALLLGVPIPYSSVGQILLPLFPQNGSQSVPTGLSQAEALWINVKQVNRFLETYSNMAKDIPPDSLSRLQADFSNISSQYLAAVHKSHLPPPELVVSMQNYLTAVRETCRASWARFNPFKMAAGLLILGVACMLCYILSELSYIVIQDGLLKMLILSGLVVGLVVAAGQLFSQGYLELSWCLGAAALSSEVLFLWWARGVSPKGRWTHSRLLTPALLVLFLRCASLLSDSYVSYEGHVVTFLLFMLSVYVPLCLNWDGLLVPFPPPDTQKVHRLLPIALPSSVVRREATILLVWLALLVGSLYLSLFFHNCREEQGTCQPSTFLSPLSRIQDNQLRNVHYVISVASQAMWVYLLHCWLRHYGNLNCSSVTAFSACFLLPLACVCMWLRWAVSATPEDTFRHLTELIDLAWVFLPRGIFCLLGLGLLLLWLDPMTVFLKTRKPLNSLGTSLPPPKYRASTGISPQAELHHLIPQLYQRIRHSLEDGGTEDSEANSRPAVEAYGLGTVYSAPLVLLCGLLGLALLLLHPEGMSIAFLLLLLEAGAVLHIHACSTNLSSLHRHSSKKQSNTTPYALCSYCHKWIYTSILEPILPSLLSDDFSVPWVPVVSWSLGAAQFFHATGHLPTFPSIQWGAAFVGFPQGHTGTVIPALLVTLNTFSSHIIFAVGCPLLLFWPLVCEVHGAPSTCSAGGEENEDAVMEMRLRENPQKFSSSLLQLAARYLFVNGAQVFASVCAAAILRRHLMVWKVFAPKLMFEASGFIVGSVFVMLGVTMVMRVDMAVGSMFKKLLPQNSR